jgi:hypothetical protein
VYAGGRSPDKEPGPASLEHPQHQKHNNYYYHHDYDPDYSLRHLLSSFPARFIVLISLKNHCNFRPGLGAATILDGRTPLQHAQKRPEHLL